MSGSLGIQTRYLDAQYMRLQDCLYVFGDLITETVDYYKTILTIDGARRAVKDWEKWRNVREMHQKKAVGTAPIIEILDNALRVGFKIFDPEAIRKVESGVYKGISVGFNPKKFEIVTINGEEIVRFIDYDIIEPSLVDRPANPDARIDYFTRSEFDIADKEEPWTFDWQDDADAIIDKFGWEGMKTACLYYDPDNAVTKAGYKLPVMKLKNGKLTLYFYALVAAMAALNGARSGVGISRADKEHAYEKIKRYYKLFGEEAPELRLMEVRKMNEKELQEKVEGGIVAFFERMLGINKSKQEQNKPEPESKKEMKKTVVSATAFEHAKELRKAFEAAKDTEKVAAMDQLLLSVEPDIKQTTIEALQERLAAFDTLQQKLSEIENINKNLQTELDKVLTAQKSRTVTDGPHQDSRYKGAFIPY